MRKVPRLDLSVVTSLIASTIKTNKNTKEYKDIHGINSISISKACELLLVVYCIAIDKPLHNIWDQSLYSDAAIYIKLLV